MDAATGPVIVTGSTGFVGRALMHALGGNASRLHMAAEDWNWAARDLSFKDATVFHLAALAHRTRGASPDDYAIDNVDKTVDLAAMAAHRGARRIVFLSTLKVNGEDSGACPYTAADVPAPKDAYARSKLAAEEAVSGIAARHGLLATIVRAPLVYGAGARGNLRSLMRLADSPWPLPFAAIDNRRSFVHVDDLAALLVACMKRPEAEGRTYLAAHPVPVSTRDLVAAIRAALGRPRRLFAVRPTLLERAAAACGQGERMRRLTGSLEADASPAERELGWTANVTLELAVADMVRGYREAAR